MTVTERNQISTLAFYEHKNGALVEKRFFDVKIEDHVFMCRKWLKMYPFGICIAEFQDGSEQNLTVGY